MDLASSSTFLHLLILLLPAAIAAAHGPIGIAYRENYPRPSSARRSPLTPSTRRSLRGTPEPEGAILPLKWGRERYGIAEFVANVTIDGRSYTMVVDTGSDLNWIKERSCSNLRRSFTTPCDSWSCEYLYAPLSSKTCKANPGPCHYDVSYADGTTSLGVFTNRTVSLPGLVLNNVLLGCTIKTTKGLFDRVDGILAMGDSRFGLPGFLPGNWPLRLGYCFNRDDQGRSYLALGANPQQFAAVPVPMVELRGGDWLYAVQNVVVSLQGEGTWSYPRGGKTSFDTGSSVSYFNGDLYDGFVNALLSQAPFAKLRMVESAAFAPFEYCYVKPRGDEGFVFPKVGLRFGQGAVIHPPDASLFIDQGVDDVMCLGVLRSPAGENTIGNFFQRGNLWFFDLEKNTMAVTPSNCDP